LPIVTVDAVRGKKNDGPANDQQRIFESLTIITPIDDFLLLYDICAVKICNRLHR